MSKISLKMKLKREILNLKRETMSSVSSEVYLNLFLTKTLILKNYNDFEQWFSSFVLYGNSFFSRIIGSKKNQNQLILMLLKVFFFNSECVELNVFKLKYGTKDM